MFMEEQESKKKKKKRRIVKTDVEGRVVGWGEERYESMGGLWATVRTLMVAGSHC